MRLKGTLAAETKIQLNHLMYERGYIVKSLHERTHALLIAELTHGDVNGIIRDNKRK